MLEKQRHRLILDFVQENQYASVRTLTEQFNSSEATIRRDISKLALQEKLRKIRGGAEAIEAIPENRKKPQLAGSAFLVSKEQNIEAKRRIAAKAVELCEEGESIIINGGSSTFMMSEFLASRHLNILTNSFYLAQELIENSENQVTLPGGEIYRRQGIILSAFENDTIKNYLGAKMFMGTPGIGEFGVMESDPLLIRAEQKLLNQSEKLIILADHTKLGRRSNFIFTPLDRVHTLITDTAADKSQIKLFTNAGIQVIQV